MCQQSCLHQTNLDACREIYHFIRNFTLNELCPDHFTEQDKFDCSNYPNHDSSNKCQLYKKGVNKNDKKVELNGLSSAKILMTASLCVGVTILLFATILTLTVRRCKNLKDQKLKKEEAVEPYSTINVAEVRFNGALEN